MDCMDTSADPPASGEFDARYLAFLETIASLRPSLHRYCARMTGSSLDGEDVVQEALFQAYRKLDAWDDSRPLAPWLFRIAHNRCIDFLRRRGVQIEADTAALSPDVVDPIDPPGPDLGRAVEQLVTALPPKERACVLLKDVFDYTLEEIAELVDSSVGGVKAALSRGRLKLASLESRSAPARATTEDLSHLLHLYIERFNQRDWDGLRELISADARLQVADRFSGRLSDSPYFGQYDRRAAWRMALGDVDGHAVVVALYGEGDAWGPRSVARLELVDGRVVGIVDYVHCPWVLAHAVSLEIGDSRDVSPSAGRP
jgi:RNA polymerase sigma-70 factor (ECF subfamily)